MRDKFSVGRDISRVVGSKVDPAVGAKHPRRCVGETTVACKKIDRAQAARLCEGGGIMSGKSECSLIAKSPADFSSIGGCDGGGVGHGGSG